MAKLSNPAGYLAEHYTYELNMLRGLFKRLNAPQIDPAHDQLMQNAMIESFCMHARVLVDFYSQSDSKNDQHTDMTADFYCPGFAHKLDGDTSNFRTMVNKQIAHLTVQREGAIKIDDQVMQQVLTKIEDLHTKFRNSVPNGLAFQLP